MTRLLVISTPICHPRKSGEPCDMKIKNTKIEIIQGDITDLHVDAIVNPAQPSLVMDAGLAGVIKGKAGKIVADEAAEKGPVDVGASVFTNAGQLNANFVIHAVTVDESSKINEHQVRAAVRSALECAQELKVARLALPAIGCGAGGFPFVGSAKIMVQEILKFCRKDDVALTEIIFCLNDQETFEIFDKQVRGYITHIQEELGPGPYVTVDIIIELEEGLVIIERSNPPYGYALPGGFLDRGESLEQAACREAKEETNMDLKNLRQFHTYSDPNRDPRFHTISTVFIAKGEGTPQFGDDAKGLKVVPYAELLIQTYAFDHKSVIQDYLNQR